MWIVFGNKTGLERVPGGMKVERKCESCGETATFYEKRVTKTFRLYFVDVFDYERHRVMACGCCGASFGTDELGKPLRSEDDRNLAGLAAGYVERAGSAVSQGIDSLGDMLSGRRGGEAPAARERQSRDERPALRPGATQGMSDEELEREVAAIRGAVDDEDDAEARFRALEEKAKKGP